MGTGPDILDIVGRLRRDGYFASPNRAVAEIGAQQLANSFLRSSAEVAELAALFGIDRPFTLAPPIPSSTVHGLELLDPGAPYAREFWAWLGFDYATIDVDGSPGALPLDLNVDSVPEEMRNRYDLVTNLGTTEHVVNQWNAFEIVHDLTKPGGIMLHNLPCQGNLAHGLVNYTPKFFWYLERSNNYTRLDIEILPALESYPVPGDVLNGARVHGEGAESYRVRDAGLRVLLRKNDDADFVPPIDVPTGTRTQYPDLRRRYAPVFDPEFETSTRRERMPDKLKQAQADLKQVEIELGNCRTELGTTRTQLNEAHDLIEAVQNSASWRITAPLRRLATLARPGGRANGVGQ